MLGRSDALRETMDGRVTQGWIAENKLLSGALRVEKSNVPNHYKLGDGAGKTGQSFERVLRDRSQLVQL